MAAVHPSTSCRLSAVLLLFPDMKQTGYCQYTDSLFCYWIYLSMSATKFRYNFLLITQRCSDSVKHLELLQALPVNGCFLNVFKMSDWYREPYPVCRLVQNMAVEKHWKVGHFSPSVFLCMLKSRGGGEGIGSALFVLLHALCSVLFVRRHLVNLLPWPRFSAKLLCQRASFKSYSLLESQWLCNKG